MGYRSQLGVCYYPEHWPSERWSDDARQMRALGIEWVRIGEFAWSIIEPTSGDFHFEWLDEAIDTLHAQGLSVVLGTPSACPPRWMLDHFDDLLAVDIHGRVRGFGSRRHYRFSHEGYVRAAASMAGRLAARYGSHPALCAWQVDNEYGCHQTTLCFSDATRRSFQRWLERRYETVACLNTSWGNVFWSQQVRSFDEVELPHQAVTQANPSCWMDFHRFSSEAVKTFHQAQVEAIRAYSDAPVCHNFMGATLDFDHHDLSNHLDIAGWDSYPLGLALDALDESREHQLASLRVGDPDFQAFHHDLYRGVGRGRFWVMEQQPGPVNWASANAFPLNGAVRLWTWEAWAHGAQVVSYFRWRQVPFAQEQRHAGLLGVDGTPEVAIEEIAQLVRERDEVGPIVVGRARIGIVFDYAADWAWRSLGYGNGPGYFSLVLSFYRGLRTLGLTLDVVSARQFDRLNDYSLLIIPGLLEVPQVLQEAIKEFEGTVLWGPRTGVQTEDLTIPVHDQIPDLGITMAIRAIETLPRFADVSLKDGGSFVHLTERVVPEGVTKVEAFTTSGNPALLRGDRRWYVAGWPDDRSMRWILARLCVEAQLDWVSDLPDRVRLRTSDGKTFLFNYSDQSVRWRDWVLPPAGVIWVDEQNRND